MRKEKWKLFYLFASSVNPGDLDHTGRAIYVQYLLYPNENRHEILKEKKGEREREGEAWKGFKAAQTLF